MFKLTAVSVFDILITDFYETEKDFYWEDQREERF